MVTTLKVFAVILMIVAGYHLLTAIAQQNGLMTLAMLTLVCLGLMFVVIGNIADGLEELRRDYRIERTARAIAER